MIRDSDIGAKSPKEVALESGTKGADLFSIDFYIKHTRMRRGRASVRR